MTRTVKAKVKLVLEIEDVGDRWDGTATLDQIEKQATESARSTLGLMPKDYEDRTGCKINVAVISQIEISVVKS